MYRNKNLSTAACLALACATWGCTTFSTETAQRDSVTADVGVYSAAPQVQQKPRVGVPPFRIVGGELRNGQFELVAADELTTLAHRSGRFQMIERAQLEQLLAEQELEGIVDTGELARPARVRGVDLLLLGKVDDFRTKRERARSGAGAKLPGFLGGLGGKQASYQSGGERLTVECGVDLRLVDPESGEIVAAHFGQFQKSDTASGLGIQIEGVHAESENDFQISQDSQGKLLRLALDDTLRKMLPEIDRHLVSRATPAEPAVAVAFTDEAPESPGAFCTDCGAGQASGAAFCAACGSKVE